MKGITRQRIVEAALGVLDEGGIDAVTVRAVATRLGVQAPALYYHVRGKQELLDEMGTEIQRRVNTAFSVSGAQTPWPQALRAYARAMRAEYLRHRDGARTFSGTRLTDAGVLRDQEPWLQRGVDDGLTLDALVASAEVVTAFVVGFVIEEQERRQSAQSDASRYATETRDALVGDDAPLVRASGHGRDDHDARFETQLGIVMAGIDAETGNPG